VKRLWNTRIPVCGAQIRIVFLLLIALVAGIFYKWEAMGIMLFGTMGLYFVAAQMNALPADNGSYEDSSSDSSSSSSSQQPVESSRRIRGINDLPQDQPRGGS